MTHRVDRWAARLVLPVFLVLLGGVFPLFSATGQAVPDPETPPISLLNDNLVQNRPMQALYQAEARAAILGWSPELLASAGSIWYANGDPWLAADYWWAAAQAAPGRAEIVRRLAETLLETQRWPEASDALNQLLALLPDDYWAHYQLGLMLAASNPTAARQHLEAAGTEGAYQDTTRALLLLLPDSANAAGAMRVGAALAERDLWAYAEIAFSFAAAARQDYPEALAYTGLSRDKQGKDGSPQIAAALRLGADNPQVLYLYGLHLRAVGDYLSSQDILLQAATLEPENPAFAAETGTAYRLNGNLEQAEAWLKIAVQLSGNEPAFTELLSQFYATSGVSAEDGSSLP